MQQGSFRNWQISKPSTLTFEALEDQILHELITRPDKILIDIRRPVKLAMQQVPHAEPDRVERLLQRTWYNVLYPTQTLSKAMDLALYYQSIQNPLAGIVVAFSELLQDTLSDLGFYAPEFNIADYHYVCRPSTFVLKVGRDLWRSL